MSIERLFEDPKIRRVLECGERISMQLRPIPTKKTRSTGFFSPPVTITVDYWPDPSKDESSEWNAVQTLVTLEFYYLQDKYLDGEGYRFTWRVTDKGLWLLDEFKKRKFYPQRDPHVVYKAGRGDNIDLVKGPMP